MKITSKPIGQAGMAYVLADVKRRFDKAAQNGSATKDSQLNYDTVVKLPEGWKEKFWSESFGPRPSWIDTITHGRIKGRVTTNGLYGTGQYWVSLLKADGGWTNHTIFVDEWELSVAQQGEGK